MQPDFSYAWDKSKTLIDYLDEVRGRYAELPAYTQDGQTLTYEAVVRLSRKVASYLQNHQKLERGDRIAVQLPNTLLYPVIAWGILQAGMVIVNVNPQYTPLETERQLKDADVRAWFCADISAHLIERVRPNLQCPVIVVCRLFELHPFIQRNIAQFVMKYRRKIIKPYQRHDGLGFAKILREGGAKPWIPPQLKAEDLAMLQYTGGSTGVHMGAMLTHANLVANMEQVNHFLRDSIVPGKEILIAPLPIYHIFSFTVHCAVALLAGSHNVLILDASNIKSVAAAMQRFKFTSMTGVNTLFFALMRLPSFRDIDFRSLKFSIAGGMKLDPAVAARWEEVTGSPILEGFGMTELSPIASWNPSHANRLGTIGLPLPQTEMKLTREDGSVVDEPDTAGELWIRGPQVMKGYWRNEEQTAQHIDQDGWMRSGDLASFDKDNYWKIIGRKKRMILVSGFNVYPQEVENVLRSHPDLKDARVVGRMHPVNGESVKAYVLSEKQDLTQVELREFCRQYLTSYKIPKQFEIVNELPALE
ncbi:MAG: AMP-binding protein [Chitinophagaceae bacterium]|nr:AMP-binding protein [Oligoflexus sp.]